jgi:plasmid stability protein
MAHLTLRNVEDSLVQSLKERAAEQGVSIEEEHLRILREALVPVEAPSAAKGSLFDRIRQLGEIAPSFELETKPWSWGRREVGS